MISMQDCAGAILYSSDRAVEVCLEALQMLGCVLSIPRPCARSSIRH